MVKRALASLTIVALLASGGAPRALLQTYAWATMIATSSRTLGLREATASALRGDAPCRLCLKAQRLSADPRPAIAAAERPAAQVPRPHSAPEVVRGALAAWTLSQPLAPPLAGSRSVASPPPRWRWS